MTNEMAKARKEQNKAELNRAINKLEVIERAFFKFETDLLRAAYYDACAKVEELQQAI